MKPSLAKPSISSGVTFYADLIAPKSTTLFTGVVWVVCGESGSDSLSATTARDRAEVDDAADDEEIDFG